MNIIDFNSEMKRLEGIYPKKMTPEMLDAYWKKFEAWSPDDFNFCTTRILQEDDRFPKTTRFEELIAERHRADTCPDKPPQFFTFVCSHCNLPFSILITELEQGGGGTSCTECRFYSNENHIWSGETLLQKMNEAKMKHMNFAVMD
jgi:hypothetical protein